MDEVYLLVFFLKRASTQIALLGRNLEAINKHTHVVNRNAKGAREVADEVDEIALLGHALHLVVAGIGDKKIVAIKADNMIKLCKIGPRLFQCFVPRKGCVRAENTTGSATVSGTTA